MNNFIIFLFFVSATLFSRGAKSRIIFDLNYGMAYVNPADINSKITDTEIGVANFIPDVSGVSWAHSMESFISYTISKKFALGLGFDLIYLRKLITKDFDKTTDFWVGTSTQPSGRYYELNTGVLSYGFGPMFRYFFLEKGKFDFSASLALVYYLKFTYIEDVTYGDSSTAADLGSNLRPLEGNGSTFGGILYVSVNYYFTKYLALGLNLGYKYVMPPSLKDSTGNDINFTWFDGSASDPAGPVVINVGGPFMALNLCLDFNLSASSSSNSYKEDKFLSENLSTNDDIKEEQELPKEETKLSYMPKTNDELSLVGPITDKEVYAVDADDLYRMKNKAHRKYRRYKRRHKYRCARKMKKLYNIIKKIEIYQWNKLNDEARQEKLEKIKKILDSC